MKDQFVIACIERPDDAATLLPWAHHFAERLNHKGLMVVHVAREKVDDGWLEGLGVPYVSMVGRWRTAIEALHAHFKGILALTVFDPSAPRTSLANPKTLLREFRDCRIAYLCIPSGTPHVETSHAWLSLTHQREGKEKLVWASYLARLLGSTIAIVEPNYRDPGLRQRQQNNMRFADKVLPEAGHTNTRYTRIPTKARTNVDLAASATAVGLLVAMTTDAREQDLLDHFFKRQELLLLQRFPRQAVLFLNPRDDLYILCD